jgi:hypothetical protein
MHVYGVQTFAACLITPIWTHLIDSDPYTYTFMHKCPPTLYSRAYARTHSHTPSTSRINTRNNVSHVVGVHEWRVNTVQVKSTLWGYAVVCEPAGGLITAPLLPHRAIISLLLMPRLSGHIKSSIVALRKAHFSWTAICKQLNVKPSSARSVVKKFDITGTVDN